MLDKNFTPPKPHVAKRETTKRIKIIEDILPELMEFSEAILLTGSMAYGQDFSVTPESDIDLQILTTPELFTKIASCKFFQKYNIDKISAGFEKNVFQQFSLNFIYHEVPIECHFWDTKTFKDILHYKKESVIRMRSQTKKVSIDYAYSFDGTEDITEYADYKNDIYNVGLFPVYHIKNDILFLSRPITNILGNAIKLTDECGIKGAIRECKNITKQKLAETPKKAGKMYSIFNTLPGKNKVSEEVARMVEDITIIEE